MAFFRQHEERHLSSEVRLMSWNPKFDLIAIAHKAFEVSVYRLVGWQKVWDLTCPSVLLETNNAPSRRVAGFGGQQFRFPPSESKSSPASAGKKTPEVEVTSLEWRPDGKVLAVGYNRNLTSKPSSNTGVADNQGSSSSISLVDVENGQVFRMIEIDHGCVTSMCWSQASTSSGKSSNTSDIFDSILASDDTEEAFETGIDDKLNSFMFERQRADIELESYLPDSIEFLPKLAPLVRSFADKNDLNSFFPNPTMYGGASSGQMISAAGLGAINGLGINGGQQPSSSKQTDENVDDIVKISGQKALNILAVGTDRGGIYFFCLGIYCCGQVLLPDRPRITHLSLSSDFEFVNVIYDQQLNDTSTSARQTVSTSFASTDSLSASSANFTLSTYSIKSLKNYRQQYFVVSIIYCRLISYLKYLHDCMQQMYETWEEILLEIDNKLSNYLFNDRKRAGRGQKDILLADDFLELLVFGSLTDTLEKFLHNFTDKGLKKLGHSIENTYHTLQKLLVLHLQPVTQHIFCYVQTLRAICQWKSEFEPIGLETECVLQALKAIGSFHMKTIEFQQVIDHSVKNVDCFFKWLYIMMVRVCSDGSLAGQESLRISRHDMQLVADFINENFEHDEPIENLADASSFFLDLSIGSNRLDNRRSPSPSLSLDSDVTMTEQSIKPSGSKSKHERSRTATPSNPLRPPNRPTASNFTLDRVGQYLKDLPLSYKSPALNDLSSNHWINYVTEHKLDSLQSNGQTLVHSHYNNSSLLQEYRQLERAVRQIFNSSFKRFCSTSNVKKAQISDIQAQVQSSVNEARFTHNLDILAFIEAGNTLNLLKLDSSTDAIRCSRVRFFDDEQSNSLPLDVLDAQFYNSELITLLLQDPKTKDAWLVQLNIDSVANSSSILPFFCRFDELTQRTQAITVDIRSSANQSAQSSISGSDAQTLQARQLEAIHAAFIAVSGSRKVCCVASQSKRRVRVFEMDACEDDEPDEVNETTAPGRSVISASFLDNDESLTPTPRQYTS